MRLLTILLPSSLLTSGHCHPPLHLDAVTGPQHPGRLLPLMKMSQQEQGGRVEVDEGS